MANTYSSWEYSQGPTLYIDNSGFKNIDDNKNFTYFYIVEYGPVEYKRKVVNEKGESFYEYKYSFGSGLASRNVLGEYTFNGKTQITKTVTHSVTEAGFSDTIKKTFYIDTNMSSNIQSNAQIQIDPSTKVNTSGWAFDNQSSFSLPDIGRPYIGWKTVTRSGYRTEYRTGYSSYSYWSNTGIGWSGNVPTNGTYKVQNGYLYEKEYSSYSYTYTVQVPYSYTELYNSSCTLNIGQVRNKIKEHLNYSSVMLVLKTKSALNTSPSVYIDTSTSATSARIQLTPKNSGSIYADGYIEYYLPNSVIMNNFANNDNVKLIIQKGNCTASDGIIVEAYTHIETEVAKIPYINLLVQAYNKTTNSWSTCCTIPYLNYKEIELMRGNKQHVSKNLFLPSNLPKTDSTYRIKLDTNLIAKEMEMLTNFRLDILSEQLIPPGSFEDKKLYINNDTIEREYEVEVGDVDNLKLNILGSTKHAAKTYAGFLKKGANDISAYLRTSVIEIDKTIPEANRDKNIWFSYIDHINGGWASNNLFIANTFDFPQPHILQANDPNLVDEIIRFRILYKNLKPRSTYRLLFKANAQAGFVINNINTINSSDELNLTTSKIYSEGTYDSNKVKVTNCDYTFYTPPYKRMYSGYNDLISEHNTCGRDIQLEIEIQTKDINNSDNNEMIISIKRRALKNITIKGLQCICIDSTGTKYLDVTEPYHENVNTGRLNETHMTIYYDGIQIEQINPLLFNDMIYLRSELNKIRAEYALEPYAWSSWMNTEEIDEEGHFLGVEKNQPLRAVHFNEVKQCCLKTYEDLLALKPPVIMNTTPTLFRDNTGLIPLQEGDETSGYVLQHVLDKEGQPLDIDKYFPEWRKLIDLINRN
jgi:hypothetical protein